MFRQRIASLDEVTTLPPYEKIWRKRVGRRPAQDRRDFSLRRRHRTLPGCRPGRADRRNCLDAGRRRAEQRRDDAADAETAQRATICVSSQVGCAVNCQFCLTAKLGLQRNLTAGEIAGQVIAVLNRQAVQVGRDRINLVFMGMGEPFLNYDEFMAAVRLLVNEDGWPNRRMTVSTSGIVPGILRWQGTGAAQAGDQPQRPQRCDPRSHHAHHAQMED